jgi:hypothetical protein
MADTTVQILQLISENFEIDFDDMFNLISLHLPSVLKKHCVMTETKCSDVKCIANISNSNGIVRCSRSQKDGADFCGIHHKMHLAGKMKHGTVTNTSHQASKKARKTIQVVQCVVNDVLYFVEPKSKKTYNSMHKFVGFICENTTGELYISQSEPKKI